MKKASLVTLLLMFFACVSQGQSPTTISFDTTELGDCYTSAGIFDGPPPLSHLKRTLWSANYTIAGVYSAVWDGNDDQGNPVTGAVYPRVLCANPTYGFDGPVGTTHNSWYGPGSSLIASVYTQNNLKFAFPGNGLAFATTGYVEGVANLYAFNPASPNGAVTFGGAKGTTAYSNLAIDLDDIATDGQFLYVANRSNSSYNWVSKFNLSGTPANFTGTTTPYTIASGWVGTTINTIAYTAGNANPYPAALAVQASGNILAVAYPTANQIAFYDKTSGASIGSPVTVSAPISMCFTSAGLWAVTQSTSGAAGAVTLIASPSSGNTTSNPLSGLSNPQSVDCNQASNNIVVLDGGANQQAIEFNSSYTVIRTYGAQGGYTGSALGASGTTYGPWSPAITNDKLMVDQMATAGTYAPTVIPGSAAATSGSWIRMNITGAGEEWVICDGGNNDRILWISPANTYERQMVSGQDWGYNVVVGQNNPTRVFNYWIEYAINYSVPLNPGDPNLAGGNGSWTMKYNWAVGNQGANGSHALKSPTGYSFVEQFSNGLSYMILFDSGNLPYEIYFPASGYLPAVNLGALPTSPTHNYQYDPSGDLLYLLSGVVYKEALTGFSGSAPVRSAAVAITSPTTNAYGNSITSNDPSWNNGWNQEAFLGATTDGVMPLWTTNPYGSVATMTPATQGHNYSTGDTISLTPCGTHAQGTVTAVNGQVQSIALTNAGVNCPNGGGISGAATTTSGSGVGLTVNFTTTPLPHLGGISIGGPQYNFETNREGFLTSPDGHGTFPVTGAFGGHNGQACGVSGKHIFCLYDGQYAAYGATVYDYYEDGLLVGQFGPYQGAVPQGPAFSPGTVGNIAQWQVVTVNGDAYGYESDEAPVSPMVRWHMSNLPVYEFTGVGQPGGSIQLQ